MLLALLLSGTILQQAPDAAAAAALQDDRPTCVRDGSTYEMDACAAEDLAAAEARMQRYYAAAMGQAIAADAEDSYEERTPEVQQLEAAQAAWSAYADARCDGALEGTGTIRSLVYAGCRLEAIRQRTHDIWLDHLTFWDSTPPLLPEPAAGVRATYDLAAEPAATLDEAALPFCDASLPAEMACSLFSETPPDFGPCASPYGVLRATCAVEDAVVRREEMRVAGVDCENSMSFFDMGRCSSERLSWETARMEAYFNAALTAAYDAARSDLDTARDVGLANPYALQFLIDLQETQRNWGNYAGQVCNSAGEQYHGGSQQPLAVAGCLEDLTRERARTLWAHALGGAEGDLTWPEPKAPITEAEVQSLIARYPVDPARIAARTAPGPVPH